jgi:hypothetical protein
LFFVIGCPRKEPHDLLRALSTFGNWFDPYIFTSILKKNISFSIWQASVDKGSA